MQLTHIMISSTDHYRVATWGVITQHDHVTGVWKIDFSES